MEKINKIFNILFEISSKIRHDHYLEELYNFEEILTKSDYKKIKKAELYALDDKQIYNWFNQIEVANLTSLGLSKLLVALLKNENIYSEVIKVKSFSKRKEMYINRIILNDILINIDLTKNLEYIFYGIYPEIEILCKNSIKELTENVDKEKQEEKLYNIYIESLKNRKKVLDTKILKVRKLEIEIESKYMSNDFDRYFYHTEFVTYDEFKEISDLELQKTTGKIFEIGYIDKDRTLYNDIINGKIEKILKNLSKTDKIWINPKSINDIFSNPKIKEFIEKLEKNNVIILVNKYDDKSIYWNIESLKSSLNIIHKWKTEIIKEIEKTDKSKFLKSNPEIKKTEIDDFLKLKFAYIKLANNLMIDNYSINITGKYTTQILQHEKNYLNSSQTIERVKNGMCICASFALILKSLCESLDLQIEYIRGVDDLGVFHAWNKVKIGDFWYNLDYLWDINRLQNKENPEYLLKSKKNFFYHYEFKEYYEKDREKNLSKKDFDIDTINKNFIYDEIIKYRTKEESKRLKEIKKIQNKLVKYNRIEKLVKKRCKEYKVKELKKLLEKEDLNKIYNKYIIINLEREDLKEFVSLEKELFKFAGLIIHIKVKITDIKECSKECLNLFSKLKANKYEKEDYIVFDILNYPEIKYLNQVFQLNI